MFNPFSLLKNRKNDEYEYDEAFERRMAKAAGKPIGDYEEGYVERTDADGNIRKVNDENYDVYEAWTDDASPNGNVQVSSEVIAVCAANAAIKTPGVAKLSGGITEDIKKRLHVKESPASGIVVTQVEEGVELDVHVIVEYNVKIPAVAWDLQVNVKKAVEEMTDVNVLGVNIHVQGVNIPGTGEGERI